MQKLVEQIDKSSVVAIRGYRYPVLGKSNYVGASRPSEVYTKVFLAEKRVLVFLPHDDLAYFGRDVGSVGIEPPFQNQIEYGGESYQLVENDYQIVIQLEFGAPLQVEGEVEFWDFESVGVPEKLISIAVVQRTQSRSDILAKKICCQDVNLLP